MSEYGDAAAALRRVGALETTAWRRSGWYLRFLLPYGAAQLVIVPALVLLPHPLGAQVSVGLNTVMVIVLSAYVARQRTVRPGFGWRHGTVIGTWAAAFVATSWLGSTVWHGSVPFAAVATLACLLPFAAGAWFEIRRTA
ncbi:hypothetical protein OG897_36885 [Streptomyces sp. NBC_00237]|uniref:hypothetical protein n=1 Tax=Streptomyces sp. NBC_00237 TaxID=2975687 RepID=UPI00224F2120|nr:hypothetical protein [Streptomyces sp. NBC_00237]MCX5206965.1 hypothetical protein [Streptomyces sp. NBC_00237]